MFWAKGSFNVLGSSHLNQAGKICVWHFGDWGYQLRFADYRLVLMNFVSNTLGKEKKAKGSHLCLWFMGVWKRSPNFSIWKSQSTFAWSCGKGGCQLWSLAWVRTHVSRKKPPTLIISDSPPPWALYNHCDTDCYYIIHASQLRKKPENDGMSISLFSRSKPHVAPLSPDYAQLNVIPQPILFIQFSRSLIIS